MAGMRWYWIVVILRASAIIIVLSLLATPALGGQRVALVIGNGTYAHAPSLANPLNDATDVGAALDRLGFKVTRIENAGYSELRRGLQQFALAASASEVAVVFYAGHGIEVDRRNFLVPVDARLLSDADVEFEAVPLDLLSRAVERARGLRLIVLDACRDNPFAAAMQRAGGTRSIGRGLARIEPSGETLVAYAAKEGTVAADGEGRNSPYTEALLAHLEEPGLEVGLMFRKVRDAVLAETGGRQEPFVYGSLSSRGAYLAAAPEPAPSPDPAPPPSDAAAESRPAHDGITSEEVAARAYEAAERVNTVTAYEAVVRRFPVSIYAELARAQIGKLTKVATAASEEMEVEPATEAAAQQAPSATSSAPPAPVALDLERGERRQVQIGLTILGFEPGPADGLFGPKSRAAVGAWQEAKGYAVTGRLTREQADALIAAAGSEAKAAGEERLAAEREFWVSVKESGDPSDFEAYLEAYPGGVYEALTRRRLDGLIAADDAAYARAASAGTEAAYEAYLSAHPSGRHLAEAREALARERAAMRPGKVFQDCGECPEMVVVPEGSFWMGSPSSEADRNEDEGPQHGVTILSAFAVGKYEVTFAEWDACVAAGGCGGHRPADRGWGRGRHPVTNVKWEDAKAYVGWLSRKTWERYRLLSEAEWEYAARAGTTGPFHFGSTISTDRANYNGNDTYGSGRKGVYRKKTVSVGSFPANAFGLHDMHGNVWEWVEDCWHSGYAGAPTDGGAWTSGCDGDRRVLRGGSWANAPKFLRSAYRVRSSAGNRNIHVGFRVARTLTP